MESGYEIHGKFYPAVESFNLGDPVLIRELTGMEFSAFAEALDGLGPDDTVDAVVMTGLIGVCVWHANPTWPRSKVAKFVQSVPIEAVQFVGDDTEADADPPTVPDPGSPSGGMPAVSNSSEAEDASPNGSGDLTSRIGAALA